MGERSAASKIRMVVCCVSLESALMVFVLAIGWMSRSYASRTIDAIVDLVGMTIPTCLLESKFVAKRHVTLDCMTVWDLKTIAQGYLRWEIPASGTLEVRCLPSRSFVQKAYV